MLKQQKIVAIVDDDPSMLRATADLSTRLASKQRLLHLLRISSMPGPPQADYLLLDIDLGGVSGFEFAA